MNTMQAMGEVYGYLRDGDVASAQCAVCAIEEKASVLPSSMFEHVLRAAVERDGLLPFFADFFRRVYGEETFTNMVESMQAHEVSK